MIEFRDTLTGLIDEFGKGDEEDPYDLPKPAIIGDKKSKQVKKLFFSFELFLVFPRSATKSAWHVPSNH